MVRHSKASRSSTARKGRICLMDLLLMASTTSALSLSNFQFITSNGIPLGCIVAYNAPLVGCTEDDFTRGNTCSDSCVSGIERAISNIVSACEFVDPMPNSVLDLAVSGQLLPALCPNNDDIEETTTITTARVTTSTSTTRRSGTTIFTTRPTTIITTTTSSSSTPFAADPPQSETTSAPSAPPQTNVGGGVATTTSTLASEPTSDGDDGDDGEGNPLAAGGGGSPFDPIQFSSSPDVRSSSLGWLSSAAIAVGAAAWFTI